MGRFAMTGRTFKTERANELVGRAVWEMAVSDATLVDRLCWAWEHHLSLLQSPGVPWPDLADDFRDIADYFKSDPKTGQLIARTLAPDAQSHLAKEIYSFFAGVSRRHYTGSEQ
jgi:hypothetical protein